jgi:hypothetical protein
LLCFTISFFFYHILCVESQNICLQQLLLIVVATNMLRHVVSMLCYWITSYSNFSFPKFNPHKFFIGFSFHIASKHECSTRSSHFHCGLYVVVLIGASYFQFHYLRFVSKYEICFHESINFHCTLCLTWICCYIEFFLRKLISWLMGPKMHIVMEIFKKWCNLPRWTHTLILKPSYSPFPKRLLLSLI